MAREIPLLEPKDVELRVQSVRKTQYATYATLLVYKDARVDMNILDMVFGPTNWQRTHQIIDGRLYCTVSIWDEAKGQWISKQDVGTESNTEAEKGQASDAFKRACFNVGIGRELYNAPNIQIKLQQDEVYEKNGKPTTYAKFKVQYMEYSKGEGRYLVFTVIDEQGNVRFSLDPKQVAQLNKGAMTQKVEAPPLPQPPQQPQQKAPVQKVPVQNAAMICADCGAGVNEKVYRFSLERFKRPLCYNCQRK